MLTYLRSKPYLLLILATLFWGSNFVIGRVLVQEIPPMHLSVFRWCLAACFFLPFALRELRTEWGLLKRHWPSLLLLAVTGIAGFNSLLYVAVQYTTSINASLVNSSAPVLITLLSLFILGETLIGIQYTGIIISTLGVIWIVTEGQLLRLLELQFHKGDVIALGAVLCWAVYSVIMKKVGGKLPTKAMFFTTIILGIIILLPFLIWEAATVGFQFPTKPTLWIAIIYLAILPSLVSFTLWNEGVMQLGPARSAIFLHFIVLFTGLFSLFIGEFYSLVQLIGAVLIISGVMLVTHPRFLRRRNNEQIRESGQSNEVYQSTGD